MKSLIVEDDFGTRKVLLKTLATEGPCDVAVNGEEAINAIHSAIVAGEPYQLVCLDIMLPDISGLDVLRLLRATEEQHGIYALDGVKVIMTTGVEDPSTVLGAFKAGCEAYLVKPFARQELQEKIASLKKPRS